MLNSPRYPAAYPIELQCEYRLYPLPNEHVQLMFTSFKLHQVEKASFGYGRHACKGDWLEMYVVAPGPASASSLSDEFPGPIGSEYFPSLFSNHTLSGNTRGQFLGRWCGHSVPGPVLLSPPLSHLLLVFNSDGQGAGSGFKAAYQFGQNTTPSYCPTIKSTKSALHGIVTSPAYPVTHASNDSWCQSTIRVRPGYRVLLHFIQFSVEGDMKRKKFNTLISIEFHVFNVIFFFYFQRTRLSFCGSSSMAQTERKCVRTVR